MKNLLVTITLLLMFSVVCMANGLQSDESPAIRPFHDSVYSGESLEIALVLPGQSDKMCSWRLLQHDSKKPLFSGDLHSTESIRFVEISTMRLGRNTLLLVIRDCSGIDRQIVTTDYLMVQTPFPIPETLLGALIAIIVFATQNMILKWIENRRRKRAVVAYLSSEIQGFINWDEEASSDVPNLSPWILKPEPEIAIHLQAGSLKEIIDKLVRYWNQVSSGRMPPEVFKAKCLELMGAIDRAWTKKAIDRVYPGSSSEK